MLGFGDWSIAAAFYGCILVTLIGVIYGACTWNSDGGKK